MAEIITIASSTTNPRAKRSENTDKKLRLKPEDHITKNEIKNVNGIETDTITDCLIPRKINNVINTSAKVRPKLSYKSSN
jgi:hypothetical protein